MKRVLIYSHDTFGLGNIRRMLEIARHLVNSSPHVSVLIVTGSPMLHAFRIPPRIDYVKLPCLCRDVDGAYSARFLDLPLDTTVHLRAKIVRSAIEGFAPDLVLVDKKPFGVEDELAITLAEMKSKARPPKFALLLRDILDSPEATSRVWRKNGCFEAIETFYDQVLVVGAPEVFDLRREYGFPRAVAAKVKFCGYISREPGRRSRADVRQQLGVQPVDPLVLVTLGGGEDGYALARTYLAGLTATPILRRPRSHIVCGPEMADAQRAAIRRAAVNLPGVSLEDFSDDMMSLISAADVTVSMGGYNTVCELLTMGKRAVVVPRTKPSLEQFVRAERMHAMGLLHMLHPDQVTPSSLANAVLKEATDTTPRPELKSLAGLEHTTAAMLGLLGLVAAPETFAPSTLTTVTEEPPVRRARVARRNPLIERSDTDTSLPALANGGGG